MIEAVTGRAAPVIDITPEQAAHAVRAHGASAWEADHLTEMLTRFRAGDSEYVTGDVKALTGREPRSVADYIREHPGDFAAS